MIIADSVKQRFWSYVDIRGPNECWPWKKGRELSGYGKFNLGDKIERSHRISWMISNNQDLVNGDCIMHKCDNAVCCNPNHLSKGDRCSNNHDAAIKGIHQKHYMRKISLDDADMIRSLYKSGSETYKSLAEMFGISKAVVWKILTNKTYNR